MIKLSANKRIVFSIFILIFSVVSGLFAQRLDHKLGVITIQLKESSKIENVINSAQSFQSQRTDLQAIKLISAPFRIWNIRFDHNRINEHDFLNFINNSPFVENAQFDFFIENRTPPNDPFYYFQYYFNNLGQNGGTPGVDLDAEIAWETTTGGVSLNGDTIVICVIDEGFDIYHEDLFENTWINHDEIPDNGIDDDDNGYVDDYYGWNVTLMNDDISNNNNPGTHGTQVVGIAGAVGNNNTGITGLNWNIKLMLVTRGFSNSDVVAAYSYAFEARKKYNESNGTEGAFVVVTNSSWGVNYGNPNDAPVWCSIYDSLGLVGILNAAATANLDINVDEVGDLPTTCPSDFLVTTTKVDKNDEIPPNAGYGPVSIDLAAFGKDIFTTNIYNDYEVISGTSAAAPQVAGAIALLYSAPCPSFIALAKNQPQSASLLVKEYILNGVEENEYLEGITVTGGRLNVANSLQLLLDDCNYSGCYPPYSIEIDGITAESAIIDWQTGINTTVVHLRYREVGAANWIQLNNVSNPFLLDGLQPCVNYEFQVSSECGPLNSDYSLSYVFQTAGCCVPPQILSATAIDENKILLEWTETVSATLYKIFYRAVDSINWNIIYTDNSSLIIPDLFSCTAYEFQMQSICPNNQTSALSENLIAITLGCSNCMEFPYCSSSANDMSFIWINQVNIANLNHVSGNSIDGYSDHTDQAVDLLLGQSYEINLKSESELEPLPGFFKVWIDYNQNSVFEDASELILQSATPEICSDKIVYVPVNALLGSTRMRVSFFEEEVGPCGDNIYIGEVEDYCVNIEESTECSPPIAIDFHTHENSVEISWFGNLFIDYYLLKYKKVAESTWNSLLCQNDETFILNLNECTDYEFFLQSVCGGEESQPTEHFYFTTKGCGACIDNVYCTESSANTSFEWIEQIQLFTLNNISGNNDGFTHFQDQSTNLQVGQFYPMVITPGFASFPYEEYYMVWIDFDHDGIYAPDEIVYDSYFTTTNPVETIIHIPSTALLGSTRMRVIMKYLFPPTSACDYEFFGEIEEYCINIVDDEDFICTTPSYIEFDSITQFSAFVNWEETDEATSYTLRYQNVNLSEPWKYINTNTNSCFLDQLNECTYYQVQIRTVCEYGLSEFSDLSEFKTECFVSSTSEEVNFLSEINLFPNPAQEKFFVSFYSNAVTKIEFGLYDISGKLILNKKIQSTIGNQQVKFHFPKGCSDGIYFLKIKTKNQSPTVLKIIKTK